MPYKLEREKTTSTPYLLVDEERSYMRLEGKSFNENVIEFFKEVNDWLVNYLATDFGTFTFDCEMVYFNSSTVKVLLNLITKMDNFASSENKVVVNWIAADDNDIIIECGEDFQEEVENLEFNLVIN